MAVKRIDNLLNPSDNADLAKLVRKAREMGQLLEIMRRELPADIGAGISAANLRDNGELVVLAGSPAWAAKLRFEVDALIEAARVSGADVKSCRVRVSRSQ